MTEKYCYKWCGTYLICLNYRVHAFNTWLWRSVLYNMFFLFFYTIIQCFVSCGIWCITWGLHWTVYELCEMPLGLKIMVKNFCLLHCPNPAFWIISCNHFSPPTLFSTYTQCVVCILGLRAHWKLWDAICHTLKQRHKLHTSPHQFCTNFTPELWLLCAKKPLLLWMGES